MGFYQVVRFTGFSMGSALAATVLAAHVTGSGRPTVGGYTVVLWISAAICVAAAALAWFLPTERLPADEIRPLERTDGELRVTDGERGSACV